jgi:hypothetical protein
MKRLGLAAATLGLSLQALAHHAPNSYLRLDFRARSVVAQLMVPASELGYSMELPPDERALPAYLLRHVSATTPGGGAWTVRVTAVHASRYLDQPYFVADLTLLPPAGASTRDFLLTNDAVTHEVRNHVVFVVAMRDYADAALADAPVLLGALQYPARQLAIRRPASPAR